MFEELSTGSDASVSGRGSTWEVCRASSDGLPPSSFGLHPSSDGLQPSSFLLPIASKAG